MSWQVNLSLVYQDPSGIAISPGIIVVGEIITGPAHNVTTFLGEFEEFECRTVRSAPRWIVDNVDLDSAMVLRQHRDERGIRITRDAVMGNRNYVSVLQVHAIEINNSTSIQCAVYTGDARSERVFLNIQGSYTDTDILCLATCIPLHILQVFSPLHPASVSEPST